MNGISICQPLVLMSLLTCLFSQAGAEPSQTNVMTLSNALAIAIRENPELRAAAGRIDSAEGRASQARLWTNPEVSLASEDIPVKGGTFRESKNTIGLAQTIPFPGKKKLDGRIGVTQVRVSEAEMNLRILELVRDVKTAFYTVLATEGLVKVARELALVAESFAGAAQKRVVAGAAPDQEQLRAEIQLEQARTELGEFERQLASVRQELARLLGRPETSSANFIGTLSDAPDLSLLQHGPDEWLSRHPSVVTARMARQRAELELRRAKLEPYPDVTLGVDGGREGPTDSSIVEFRISLPLPIIDRSKGKKREAKANVNVAEAELVATEQQLLRDWGIATQRFRKSSDQVATYRDRILPKVERALKLVQTGFEEGKFGFIDLLDTQRTATEARLAYQHKLLDLSTAQAELQFLVQRQDVPDSESEKLRKN